MDTELKNSSSDNSGRSPSRIKNTDEVAGRIFTIIGIIAFVILAYIVYFVVSPFRDETIKISNHSRVHAKTYDGKRIEVAYHVKQKIYIGSERCDCGFHREDKKVIRKAELHENKKNIEKIIKEVVSHHPFRDFNQKIPRDFVVAMIMKKINEQKHGEIIKSRISINPLRE
jgi:hypothetical protein